MRRYTVQVITAVTVEASTPVEANSLALEKVTENPTGQIWACKIASSWDDDETIEDINQDISKQTPWGLGIRSEDIEKLKKAKNFQGKELD